MSSHEVFAISGYYFDGRRSEEILAAKFICHEYVDPGSGAGLNVLRLSRRPTGSETKGKQIISLETLLSLACTMIVVCIDSITGHLRDPYYVRDVGEQALDAGEASSVLKEQLLKYLDPGSQHRLKRIFLFVPSNQDYS